MTASTAVVLANVREMALVMYVALAIFGALLTFVGPGRSRRPRMTLPFEAD